MDTPNPCSIFATIPFVGSKNWVFTLFQPPTKPILKSCGRGGNWALKRLATLGSTGRKPFCAQIVCAAGVYSQLTNCCAAALFEPLTAASGVSICSVAFGIR